MIIDTHVHAVAADRQRYPLSPVGGRLGEWVEAKPTTSEDLIAEMDKATVERATFVQAATAYGYDNTYTIESVQAHPDRFAGVCMIDVLQPDAPAELSRLMAEGMRGIRLFTTPDPAAPWIDDPKTFPVWERTRELAIPLIIQVWTQHLPRVRKVIERFPEVPVLMDHLANDQLVDTDSLSDDFLDLAELPNVYAKISTVNLYLVQRRGLAFADYFRPLVDRFGVQRLMWGSNYPNTYDRSYSEMFTLAQEAFAHLPAADRDAIFGGTALSLWPELA